MALTINQQAPLHKKGPPKWRSTRFCLAYMVSTGLIMVFYQRVSFSMAIVCMVNHTALLPHHHSDVNLSVGATSTSLMSSAAPPGAGNDTFVTSVMTADSGEETCGRAQDQSDSKEDGPFVWDKTLQGLLLGALYWGYTVIQIPGSYLIQRYGARRVVGFGIVVMSLTHMLCHPAAVLSPWAVFTLRACMGLTTGLSIPAMYSVWGKWAPVTERSQLMGMAFAGQMIANASVFPLSALLCDRGFWGGWPSVFYVFGVLGLLWSTAWFFIVSDAPESHARISPAERDYILETRASVTTTSRKVQVPWRSMLTAPCFWAIAVSQVTYNWGFFLMISNLPLFMAHVMHFDIQSNGVFSMLPYVCLFVTMSTSGFVSDAIISHRLLSVVAVRKLFTVIGYLVPGALLVVMSHQHCSQVAAVVSLLAVAVALTGPANVSGFYINPYDIAPRYATAILTASSTMATAVGIINPYVVAAITRDSTREQWQLVFYVTAAIFALGTLIFCLLGRGEVQNWARLDVDNVNITIDGSCSDTKADTKADSRQQRA